MIDLTVRIEALDPILFGDNRSARAGEDHALADQDPSPLTLYGAIGARIAAALGASGPHDWSKAEPVLGRFRTELGDPDPDSYSLRSYVLADDRGTPWFPAPSHLRCEQRRERITPFDLLVPVPLEESMSASSGFRRRLAAPAGEPRREAEGPLLVNQDLLACVLSGRGDVSDPPNVATVTEHVYAPEGRTGIAVSNARNTAIEGRLFTRPYRRFGGVVPLEVSVWGAGGFLAWITVRDLNGADPEELTGIGFLGGDRGRARFVFSRSLALAEVRELVDDALPASDGFFLYLLTPGLAGEAWPGIDGQMPVATATGPGRWVSGWNRAANSPRESRVLLREGSVGFYLWPPAASEARRREILERFWLKPIGSTLHNEGFGRSLLGVWHTPS